MIEHVPDQAFLNSFKRDYVDRGYQRKSWNDLHFPMRRSKHSQTWTDKTMRTTVEICMWCWENGYRFMTEVNMLDGHRKADVVIPELLESQIIEIHDSEGMDSLDAKEDDYREIGVTMLRVPANPEEALNKIVSVNGLRAR